MKDPAGISIAAAEMFEFGSEIRRTLSSLESIVSMYWRSSSFDRQITSSVLQFSPIGGGGVTEGVGLTLGPTYVVVRSTIREVVKTRTTLVGVSMELKDEEVGAGMELKDEGVGVGIELRTGRLDRLPWMDGPDVLGRTIDVLSVCFCVAVKEPVTTVIDKDGDTLLDTLTLIEGATDSLLFTTLLPLLLLPELD